MVTIEIAKVVIRRAGFLRRKWRARSYGANNEIVAWTQMYKRLADAEAAAYTISEGAPVTTED